MCISGHDNHILKVASHFYDDMGENGLAAGPLNRRECIDALVKIINIRPLSIIIIDALDECTTASKNGLLEAFDQIFEETESLGENLDF